MKEGFGFIIDTNEYAGNFERELTAHITGHIGECGTGKEFIDNKIKDIFDEIILQIVDDYSCHRPCDVYERDSVIIYLNSQPSEDLISTIKGRAYGFNGDFKIKGFRLIELKSKIIGRI